MERLSLRFKIKGSVNSFFKRPSMVEFSKILNKSFCIGLSALVLNACVSLNSVSLTPIPPERNNRVSVERDKFIFLGFSFDNDFVDGAVEDLKAQCPNGKVTGLLTKDENINYFLYIFWKKRISAQGYCVKANSSGTHHASLSL